MAYRNTGYQRSLTFEVTKSVDGQAEVPVTYDGRLAFKNYAAITPEELQKLPLKDYEQRFKDFISYVEAQNPGLNVEASLGNNPPARRWNDTACPIV